MIDGSEKRNCQLAFELRNSHVCGSVNLRSGSVFISRLDVNGLNRKTAIVGTTIIPVQSTSYCSMG